MVTKQDTQIIQIGPHRIKKTRSQYCPHLRLILDNSTQTVWCEDCESNIDPMLALKVMVNHIDHEYQQLALKEQRFNNEIKKNIRLLAARKIDSAWKRKRMVPTCPHCSEAIFPEDNFGGSFTNKEHAIQKRKFGRRK